MPEAGTLMDIYEKIAAGQRISTREAEELLTGGDLLKLGNLANKRRLELHPDNASTFQIDRNINYTNICECRCRFCAFFREADAPDAYLLSTEQVLEKVDEVSDVTVHIDPEDDEINISCSGLPLRDKPEQLLSERWDELEDAAMIQRLLFRYLDGKIDVDVYYPCSAFRDEAAAGRLRDDLQKRVDDLAQFGQVRLYFG